MPTTSASPLQSGVGIPQSVSGQGEGVTTLTWIEAVTLDPSAVSGVVEAQAASAQPRPSAAKDRRIRVIPQQPYARPAATGTPRANAGRYVGHPYSSTIRSQHLPPPPEHLASRRTSERDAYEGKETSFSRDVNQPRVNVSVSASFAGEKVKKTYP